MSGPVDAQTRIWGRDEHELALVARNVTTRYIAIGVDALIGLVLLPYNVAHLGRSAYGLWALVGSITVHFAVLDLGYGGALVKFVAQYRALRDRAALNEVLSTTFFMFTAAGLMAFAATGLVAWQFPRVFKVTPEQVSTGRTILMIIGVYVAIRFTLSIYGGVVYGFQRYYLNNAVSIGSSVAVAIVNLAVLGTGHGLIELVAATTAVRILALGGFWWTAHRVYPGLHISPSLYRRERLKEVSGFSVYMLVLDWSSKLNYSADAVVVGAMLGTSAVAVWTVGQRLAEVSQQMTNQLNNAIFPLVVDSDAGRRPERLQAILQEGTRLSLALAAPVCAGLAFVAGPVIHAWVGPGFPESVLVTQILLMVVLIRVGNASAALILKGGGQHRMLAFVNSATAIVNVVMSVALVPVLGLIGVAVGTLVPVGFTALAVLYPAACRRVGTPVARGYARAVWPAIWPLAGLFAVLWLGRRFTPAVHLSTIALQLVIAGLVYQGLFLLALSRADRRYYWEKALLLWRRRGGVTLAA